MRITELAAKANVPTSTVRYYERIGLLPEPVRSENGYRDYIQTHVEMLRFVKGAQAVGLNLQEVRDILDLRQAGEPSCPHVIEVMERRVEELNRHVAALVAIRIELSRLIRMGRRLKSKGEGICPIIESERIFSRNGDRAGLIDVAKGQLRLDSAHATQPLGS